MGVKWLCFDTENDHPLLPGAGIWPVEAVRHYIHHSGGVRRDRPIQMICAAVYDFESDRLFEFRMNRPDEKAALLKLMCKAKELVSHSGQVCDLTIMEETYGPQALAPLRKVPHYDLFDPENIASLDDLARKHLSPAHCGALEQQYRDRLAEGNERWPEYRPGMRDNAWYDDGKLAKAVWDVKKTVAIYRARMTLERAAAAKY